MSLTIDGKRIADDEMCYVIAELGHNHGGSLATAQRMIEVAAQCGVSAVKFQKRDNETLYSAAMLAQPYENENSFGKTYGEHRAALEFDENDYRECQAHATYCDVSCFATAFDEPSADFLAALGMPAIKIASGGLTDYALLRHVASLNLPILLSTGGGTEKDIDAAVNIITNWHEQLAILHCTAAYPVWDYKELNLRCILTLKRRYPELVIGYSGHDLGIAMSLIAYAFGARIIEKHFTLNRASKGTDHGFSLEPVGMKKLCRDLARAHESLGDGIKAFYDSERGPLAKMRRTEYRHGRWQIGAASDHVAANG